MFALILAALMCMVLLAGCGKEEEAAASETNKTEKTDMEASEKTDAEVPGEIFDAGNVQALVPEGWKAFPQSDAFSDEEGATDPDVITICKGAETDLDLMSKPFVRFDYYGPDTEMGGGMKDWYSNVEDLEPIQCGPYTWEGFTTTDYGLMAVLTAEDGKHQYQASVYLKTDDGSISLEDDDVLAILASVKPSDGTAGNGEDTSRIEVAATENYDWWDGGWYGWWAIKNGTGVYQEPSDLGIVWDTFAEIEVYNDNTGRVTIWDTGTSRDEAMIIAYDITYEPGTSALGRLVSKRVDFFPYSCWNGGMEAVTMSEREVGWTVDPADSSVSHFENMLEITGHYESPENAGDSFDYYIYLRPWGTRWDDVRDGDTSGCLYKDMMPLYHDDWYISLLNLGYEHPVSTFEEGINAINDYLASEGGSVGSGTLDVADKEGADGKVSMAVLKEMLPWCKKETSYDMTYDESAAKFGVHGKSIESLFEGKAIYRWSSDDENYIQITFDIHEDGSETWNVTQWEGID